MKCPHCGQEHPDDFQFCPVKGQRISFMKACGNKNCVNFGKYTLPPEARFCPECGKPLEAESDNGAASDNAHDTTQEFVVEGVPFRMVRVEHGDFMMGDANSDERHRVTLTEDYYIGETQVTQELWKAVMGYNPSKYNGYNHPVDAVSWIDCHEFITELNWKLSRQLAGKNFRLPTEAEWEYAARGGNKSKGYKYAGSDNIDDVAWCDSIYAERHTHPVKTKLPNELGLYDMSGNVLEWCEDWYEDYSCRPQTDPIGPNTGLRRVMRGGSWLTSPSDCRVSRRFVLTPNGRYSYYGFRLALSE